MKRIGILTLVTILLIAAVAAITVPGCFGKKSQPPANPPVEPPQPGQPTPGTPPAPPSGTPQSGGGSTTVTVYFARWKGTPALDTVKRTVAATDDAALIRLALEALIAGPTQAEKDNGLSGTIPKSTKVLSVKIDGATAIVDFSKEIITRASAEAAVSSTGEALALESIRKTVANSPKIERVKVLVEGKSRGQVDGRLVEDFWGHVGLPEYLFIKGDLKVDPKAGGPAEQTTGKSADGMAIKSVRWSSEASKFRFVIDLENADGTAAAYCPVVKTSLSASSRVISIVVNGIRAVKDTRLAPGKPLKIGGGLAVSVTRDANEAQGDDQAVTLNLALDPAKSYTYRLFSLSNPVRVVIDVFPK